MALSKTTQHTYCTLRFQMELHLLIVHRLKCATQQKAITLTMNPLRLYILLLSLSKFHKRASHTDENTYKLALIFEFSSSIKIDAIHIIGSIDRIQALGNHNVKINRRKCILLILTRPRFSKVVAVCKERTLDFNNLSKMKALVRHISLLLNFWPKREQAERTP